MTLGGVVCPLLWARLGTRCTQVLPFWCHGHVGRATFRLRCLSMTRSRARQRKGVREVIGDEPGWSADSNVVLRHQVLRILGTGESEALEVAYAIKGSPSEVGWVFQTLVAKGLAKAFAGRAGDRYPEQVVLTAEGRELLAAITTSQTAGRIQRSCESAMLDWLDALDGEPVSDTFLFGQDARAHFFGEPFAPAVIGSAAKRLHDAGLISGTRGMGREGFVVVNPVITDRGHVVSTRHNGDVRAWEASTANQAGTTINVSGSTGVAVAAHSPGAHQVVTVSSEVREQALTLAAALQASVPDLSLSPADAMRAVGLVAQLREAAEDGTTSQGKLRALV